MKTLNKELQASITPRKALEILKEAKNFAFDQAMLDFLKSKEKLIKEKMPKKTKAKTKVKNNNKKKETN